LEVVEPKEVPKLSEGSIKVLHSRYPSSITVKIKLENVLITTMDEMNPDPNLWLESNLR
jgi:hypothetical protein